MTDEPQHEFGQLHSLSRHSKSHLFESTGRIKKGWVVPEFVDTHSIDTLKLRHKFDRHVFRV